MSSFRCCAFVAGQRTQDDCDGDCDFQGGIKAVVWTDFLQGLVMVVSSFIVIILGLIHVGGFRSVLERNLEGGRIRELE
ncbi:hypothetical protein ANN_15529 [Periplaneta americana]|uniref:Uncharacterized protein n=1 Tax=Periplaneta americana TaxID=6978 RepID=A0ABQ8SGL7_PERAM|nr:hypothetical protein ANN_15529 [Periplaneta americana]